MGSCRGAAAAALATIAAGVTKPVSDSYRLIPSLPKAITQSPMLDILPTVRRFSAAVRAAASVQHAQVTPQQVTKFKMIDYEEGAKVMAVWDNDGTW